MRYDGQYINVKRMALALDGLIRSEYPGDYPELHRDVHVRQSPSSGRNCRSDAQTGDDLRLVRAVEGRHEPRRSQRTHGASALHQHSTFAAAWPGNCWPTQDTPNRQVVLITDGLPTAHFEDSMLYMLYPPHPRTEEMTMREGRIVCPGRHHDQHVSGSQLVTIGRRHSVCSPAERTNQGTRLLHRRRRPRPVRRLGLPQPETRNPWLRFCLAKQTTPSQPSLECVQNLMAGSSTCSVDSDRVSQ